MQQQLASIMSFFYSFKISTGMNGEIDWFICFVKQVQSHSTIRFKKRKGKARMHMRGRRRSMPSADDERSFLSWVKRKYKAVTSYSEVDGDKLLFYVGQGELYIFNSLEKVWVVHIMMKAAVN